MRISQNQFSKAYCCQWTIVAHLETVKKVIELLRWEVPCQLGQEVMDILHDSLMLTSLQKKNKVDVWVNKISQMSSTSHLHSLGVSLLGQLTLREWSCTSYNTVCLCCTLRSCRAANQQLCVVALQANLHFHGLLQLGICTCAAQMLSRSCIVRAFSLITKRRIFSSFSTYCGWCKLSLSTMDKMWFCWIHSYGGTKDIV